MKTQKQKAPVEHPCKVKNHKGKAHEKKQEEPKKVNKVEASYNENESIFKGIFEQYKTEKEPVEEPNVIK